MEAAAENTEFLVFIWGTSLGGRAKEIFHTSNKYRIHIDMCIKIKNI